MTFDDREWRHIWERNLNPVERHAIAMAVWRRRSPADRFEAIVAVELARRWRRHTVALALLYSTWTLFWSMLALDDLRDDAMFATLLPPTCAVFGVMAVAACLLARRHIGGYLQQVMPAG